MPEPALRDPVPAISATAPPGECANCHARLYDRYCGRCGQDSRDEALTLRRFAVDSVVDVLNLDGRIGRTMRALMNPGRLTDAYLAGKRIAYVPPFRLAFTCSLVLLLVIAFRLPREAAITNSTGFIDDLGAVAGHQAAALTLLALGMLPGLALVVKWVCPRREGGYMAGLVLLLHEHALAALTVASAVLLSLWLSRSASVSVLLALLAAGAVHVMLAIRHVYRASWVRTVLSWVVVMSGYVSLVGISFLVVAIVQMIRGG